jgi:cytochrome c oxidase subunit 2
MLIGSSLILLAVLALLGAALFRNRGGDPPRLGDAASRNIILYGGLIIPVIVLFGLLVSSVLAGKQSSGSGPRDALTVRILGRQWWWDISYLNVSGGIIARTANEIHIPVGQPVRVILESSDVIHSFWVPNLQGKTDLVPGRTNASWIQAAQPGVFRGQCAEFCGAQHAHMAFEVVAQPADRFREWLAWQGKPAIDPSSPETQEGRRIFLSGPCVMCHAVRGTIAAAGVGPDLTHVAGRRTIAAATLLNRREHLSRWIANAQSIKPGARMPRLNLDKESLSRLVGYLETLQ